MVFAIREYLLSLHPLNLLAALPVISLAPLVEPVDRAADLANVEGLERIVKKNHLGLGPVALTPELLFPDDALCRPHTVLPIDAVDARHADCAPRVQADDKRHVIIAFM